AVVCPGRHPREADESATEIQDPHSWREVRLFADQIELVLLRLVEGLGVLPISAGVDHALVQHHFIEIVSEIVMLLRDLAGSTAALHVREDGLEGEQLESEASGDLLLDIDAQEFLDEQIERFALPPPIHVRFAEAD